MLEVQIDKIALGAGWGFSAIRPLAGTLAEDFHELFLNHAPCLGHGTSASGSSA
jgi:acetamidase/formamidase